MPKAWDIHRRRGLDRADPSCAGWCFGLPPGIAPEQWPLDPDSGYPLQHGFTLLLPEGYRAHGPEIAALSFFSIAPDHNDGGPTGTPGIGDAILLPDKGVPADDPLRAFREHARAAHPRLHRMVDEIFCQYAVLLLTRAEYDGPLCRPPEIARHPALADTPAPDWLEAGSAAAYWGNPEESLAGLGLKVEETHKYREMQGAPERRLDYCLPFVLEERAGDPNAGRTPVESWDEGGPDGYETPWTPDYERKPWAEDMAPNHIGGTMWPVQGVPDIGPLYIEFEEDFGGYNFGGGNAQLDLATLKFDWACG